MSDHHENPTDFADGPGATGGARRRPGRPLRSARSHGSRLGALAEARWQLRVHACLWRRRLSGQRYVAPRRRCVILNSSGKEEAPFRLLRSEAGKPGRIRVWVMGKNGRGVANIRVELKAGDEHFEATTDSDGAAVFPDAKGARAVSFEVRVYSVRAGPFEGNPSDRDFYFEINGDAITQVLFKNERLAIEEKGLVMKHWNGSEEHTSELQSRQYLVC